MDMCAHVDVLAEMANEHEQYKRLFNEQEKKLQALHSRMQNIKVVLNECQKTGMCEPQVCA